MTNDFSKEELFIAKVEEVRIKTQMNHTHVKLEKYKGEFVDIPLWELMSKHHNETCLKHIDDIFTINNYSLLNNEHNWEDLCIWLRNQQTQISDIHN